MSPTSPSNRNYEDKKHQFHFSSSRGYGKKRRPNNDSDLEDKEYVSRREKESPVDKDVLADFRANVEEEEARRHRSHDHRRTDSAPSRDRRHREYDVHASDRRHRDYGSNRSHHHYPRDQDYLYHDEVSERRSLGRSSPRGHQGCDRTARRGRSRSEDRGIVGHQRHHSSSADKPHKERETLPVDRFKDIRGNDRRGRSRSRSSSTSRSLPSRSSSSTHSDYRSSRRKRRRTHSRSRSTSRDRKKDRRDHKERRSSRKKKDRETNETKRSVLTGKKLKLKVKKDKDDVERDAKRQELLKFLNSACD